jgi:hypothetical protein
MCRHIDFELVLVIATTAFFFVVTSSFCWEIFSSVVCDLKEASESCEIKVTDNETNLSLKPVG